MGQLQHPVLGTLEVPDRLLQPENREELEQNLLQLAADSLPDDEAWYQTFTKQFGRSASETARGAADLIGMDKPEDDYVHEFVRRARAIQNPKAAVAGQLFGAVGDVPSYLFGGFARKGAGFLEDIITRGISIGGISGGLMPVYEMFGDDRLTNAAVGAALGGALGGSAGLVLRKLGYKTEEELAEALRNASPEERANIEQQIDEVLQLESPQAFDARKREEEVLGAAKSRAEELQKEAELQQIRERGDTVGEEVQADRVAREFETNLAEQRNKTLNMQMRQAQDEINAKRKAEYDSQVAEITQRVRQERQAELKATMQSKIVPDSMRMPIEDAVAKAKKNVTSSQNKLKYIQKQIDAIESGKAAKGTKGRGINMLRSEQERLQRDLTTDQAFLKQAEEVKAARKESVQLNKQGTSPVVEQRVAEQVAKLQQPQTLEPVQVPVQQPVQVPREQLQAIPEAFSGASRPAPVASTAPPNVGTSSGRFAQGQVQRIGTPQAPVSPSQSRSAQPSATPQAPAQAAPAAAPAVPEQGVVARTVDAAIGAISTRIEKFAPSIMSALRNFERRVLEKQANYINPTEPFFKAVEQLTPAMQRELKGHLYNGRMADAMRMMNPEMRRQFMAIRSDLKKVYAELKAAGIDVNQIDDYFPRKVADVKGLRDKLNREHSDKFTKAIDDAVKKNGNKPLSPEQEEEVLNKVVRDVYRPKDPTRRGNTAARTLGELPDELLDFYHEPSMALTSYYRNMVDMAEKAKFFGRNMKVTDENTIDAVESIGNVIRDARMMRNLTPQQVEDLTRMLTARFVTGEQAPNAVLRWTRDTGYMGTIGNMVSAITNLGDLGTSGALHGLGETIAAAFGKNKYNVVKMGIDHSISHELMDNKATAKALQKVFTWSGFRFTDRLGKNTLMNAAMSKNEKLAKTEAGKAALRKRWEKYFGDETETLLVDLEKGNITENTKLLAFHELSNVQPISLSEMPQYYLEHPDGRIVYMLKSFTLKQLDLVRRHIVGEAKQGNYFQASKNMALLGGYLAAANTGTQVVKDWILGRDIDPDQLPEQAMWNVFSVFGVNKYIADRYLSQGDVMGAVSNTLLPPVPVLEVGRKAVKETGKMLEDEEYNYAKLTKELPVVGSLIYSHFGGGKENYNDRLAKAGEE